MIVEQPTRSRAMEISQDQPLIEGQYADLQDNLELMITPWPYAINKL